MNDFSFEQLLTFVTVYEQKAFSKAALQLNRHRSTVGQVVTNLEDQLAIALFEREGKGVCPTKEGELLYHYAKQMVENAHTFSKVAHSLSLGGLDRVTIAYCSFLSSTILSAIRGALLSQFPTMKVNYEVRTKPEIENGLNDGSIHFGIVNVHHAKLVNSINPTFLKNIHFAIFTAQGHPLTCLDSSRVLSVLKNTKQFVLKSLLADDISDRIILSKDYELIDQLSVILTLVNDGYGWALMPRSILQTYRLEKSITEVICEEVKDDLIIPISLWCTHSKQNFELKKCIVNAILTSAN